MPSVHGGLRTHVPARKFRPAGHKFRQPYLDALRSAQIRAARLGASPRCDVVPHTFLVCSALVNVQPIRCEKRLSFFNTRILVDDIQAAARQREKPICLRIESGSIKVCGLDSVPRVLVSTNCVPSLLSLCEMEALLYTVRNGMPGNSVKFPELRELGIVLDPHPVREILTIAIGKANS